MSSKDEYDQHMQAHRSDRGLVHIGTRATCLSADCPPADDEDD